MNDPVGLTILKVDPFRVLFFVFLYRGLKPTAIIGMPLRGMKQSILIIAPLAGDREIPEQT